jgi:aspartate/methionine/tyrosine aminotransferase
MSIQFNRDTPAENGPASARLPERLTETDFARRFNTALQQGGLDLRTSNPTHVDLHARDGCLNALRDASHTEELETYNAQPAGCLEARQAIATYYERRNAAVDPKDIVLCASTSEAYTWLGKLLADPGDSIATPTPSYPLFEHLLNLEALTPTRYNIAFDGQWHTDIGTLRSALARESTRAVIDVSPNNPTGHRLRGDSLDSVSGLLADRTVPLIVDEVFIDYNRCADVAESILAPLQRRPASQRPRALIVSGLSKVAGLPGAKLGWIVLDGPDAWRRQTRRRLRFIADTFLSVTNASQLATPGVLSAADDFQTELNARLASHADQLTALIDDIPVASRHSGAHGWYELIRLPHTISSGKLAVELAEQHDVGVQPGFLYDLPETTLVVSLLPTDEVFDRGIDCLHAGLRAAYTH